MAKMSCRFGKTPETNSKSTTYEDALAIVRATAHEHATQRSREASILPHMQTKKPLNYRRQRAIETRTVPLPDALDRKSVV